MDLFFQKKADKLEMKTGELLVWGIQDGKQHPCIVKDKESSNKTDSFICHISGTHSANFRELQVMPKFCILCELL